MKISDGTWKVTGKTGVLRFLFGDVKHIKGDEGFNRWMGIKWGWFDILWVNNDQIHLTYRKSHIVDILTVVDEDTLTGKFYSDAGGKRIFIGDFEMTRVKNG